MVFSGTKFPFFPVLSVKEHFLTSGQNKSGPFFEKMKEDQGKTVDPRLLEVLVCPVTKSTLRYDREKQELISDSAKLAYPIRGGVPIMLPDEAREIGE